MSLVWVVVGSILQLFLAYFLFMLVVFSPASAASGEPLVRWQMALFNGAMYGLPGLCLVSAALVIYGYRAGWSTHAYWWYALPIVAATGFVLYVLSISRQ